MFRGTKKARRIAIVLVALALLTVAPIGAAGAIEPDFEGVGVFAEECGGETSLFTIALEGSFTGCLYTDEITRYKLKPNGAFIEEGTETIVGCWNSPDGEKCGTLSTTYRYIATFDADGNQLTGGCEHPFVGGTGDFAGATGGFVFQDDLDLGIFNFRGVIDLP